MVEIIGKIVSKSIISVSCFLIFATNLVEIVNVWPSEVVNEFALGNNEWDETILAV